MRGSLGEKIGEGAWSDVHAWAPGQVVKLFKVGFTRRHSWWEARMTRAAPAPEVFDEVAMDGRFGVVLERLDGPTLAQLSRSGAMTLGETGAILATLAISVHKIAPPSDVLSLRDLMNGSSRLCGGMLPEHIATGILALIERLAPGDGAMPWRPPPQQRDHDGGGSEMHRLGRCDPCARRLGSCALSRGPLRSRRGHRCRS